MRIITIDVRMRRDNGEVLTPSAPLCCATPSLPDEVFMNELRCDVRGRFSGEIFVGGDHSLG